jgi:hypothetical protein
MTVDSIRSSMFLTQPGIIVVIRPLHFRSLGAPPWKTAPSWFFIGDFGKNRVSPPTTLGSSLTASGDAFATLSDGF